MTLRLRDISNEAILLAGGARAILLQVAMPAVGRGVADHSDFTADPVRRLRNTLTYLYVLVYGTPQEVGRITGYVDRAHAPVHSTPGEGSPDYDAFDPQQQLWVAATLYDSALTVYGAVFGEPEADDSESLYRQYAVIGTALQMPAELWPTDRAAFAEYWRESRARLRVDESARRICRDLLYPVTGPLWVRAAMPFVRFLTAGFLDAELRSSYGLPWGPRRERRFARALRLLRLVYPRLPGWVRHWPARHYLTAFRSGSGRR